MAELTQTTESESPPSPEELQKFHEWQAAQKALKAEQDRKIQEGALELSNALEEVGKARFRPEIPGMTELPDEILGKNGDHPTEGISDSAPQPLEPTGLNGFDSLNASIGGEKDLQQQSEGKKDAAPSDTVNALAALLERSEPKE